jgi:signal transduction histidine kinase
MVALESSKLFSGLTQPEIDFLKPTAVELAYEAGQEIFKEGDRGDGMYVVKAGLVEISAVLKKGEPRILSKLGEGEFFGEMAVLDNEARSATAKTTEPTVIYFISSEELRHMLERLPRLSTCLIKEISRRLREFNRQYLEETLQTERLAIIGRFARSIVHDLKNPLNIIGISAEMSGMESATAEMRLAARNRIRKQVERISNMVNELLEFTRGSQTSFVLAPVDWVSFVQQTVEDIRPEVGLKSVSIEFVNQPPQIEVQLNPERMARVFQNLAHNGTDAMPEGGKLLLRFKVENKEIITEMEDTGEGIAPEIAHQLFEAFVTFGKAHGTGLGLSICKKIVEDHQGRIYARNEPGRGAIFVFHLPIYQGS